MDQRMVVDSLSGQILVLTQTLHTASRDVKHSLRARSPHRPSVHAHADSALWRRVVRDQRPVVGQQVALVVHVGMSPTNQHVNAHADTRKHAGTGNFGHGPKIQHSDTDNVANGSITTNAEKMRPLSWAFELALLTKKLRRNESWLWVLQASQASLIFLIRNPGTNQFQMPKDYSMKYPNPLHVTWFYTERQGSKSKVRGSRY